MSIEEQLREQLRREAEGMQVPPAVDARVRRSYADTIKREESVPMKRKPLVAAVIAGLLLFPTGAFAYGVATDDLYGGFDTVKRYAKSVTMQTYTQLGMKLSGAKSELGAEDYGTFIALLKDRVALTVEYWDDRGHVDSDRMTPEEYAEHKRVLMELQPYFDRLNHTKISRDVLSPADYERFIEAHMTYNSLQAQLNWDDSGPLTVGDVPAESRDRFLAATAVMEEVENKIRP